MKSGSVVIALVCHFLHSFASCTLVVFPSGTQLSWSPRPLLQKGLTWWGALSLYVWRSGQGYLCFPKAMQEDPKLATPIHRISNPLPTVTWLIFHLALQGHATLAEWQKASPFKYDVEGWEDVFTCIINSNPFLWIVCYVLDQTIRANHSHLVSTNGESHGNFPHGSSHQLSFLARNRKHLNSSNLRRHPPDVCPLPSKITLKEGKAVSQTQGLR